VKDDEIVEIARYEEEPGPEGEGETADAIDLRSSVVVRAPASRAYIVKLADYGTADIDLASLGMPILADNFATLENTPPDFLLLGNGGATQSFAADAFALGLSALHMFTGSMPYEEILEEVECPVKLRRDLTKIWTKDPAYAAVGSIVDDETTLHDTLYRFFVLFGFPKQEMVGGLYNYNGNPVLRAVAKCFRFRKSTTEGRGKGWKTFCAHRQKYALFDSGGSSASNMAMVSGSVYIQRARERMREIDGMETLVRQMLHYDPTRRIMMEGALRSPVFDCLREYS
jgi:serine/threonine protein kinase